MPRRDKLPVAPGEAEEELPAEPSCDASRISPVITTLPSLVARTAPLSATIQIPHAMCHGLQRSSAICWVPSYSRPLSSVPAPAPYQHRPGSARAPLPAARPRSFPGGRAGPTVAAVPPDLGLLFSCPLPLCPLSLSPAALPPAPDHRWTNRRDPPIRGARCWQRFRQNGNLRRERVSSQTLRHGLRGGIFFPIGTNPALIPRRSLIISEFLQSHRAAHAQADRR